MNSLSKHYISKALMLERNVDNALANKVPQQLLYGACFIIHLIFVEMFRYIIPIAQMYYFNIGSCALYAILFITVTFFNKSKKRTVAGLALLEIVVHAALATIYVGWGSGFAMFLVCAAPIPFYMPYKKPRTSYICCALIVICFIAVRLYVSVPENVINSQAASRYILYIYLFNSIMSFVMIIFISTLYISSRMAAQQQLNSKNELLTKLASIDPLTQLFNRRAMMEYISQIHDSSIRNNSTYVIVLCDIDDFKKVNDNYGHDLGDVVLKEVSKIITRDVPSEGYICRWGGEEILFAIPNTELDEGKKIAEKIRNDVQISTFRKGNQTFSVSLTMGIEESNLCQNYEFLINQSDKYLYYGKETGKNIVVSIDEYNPEINLIARKKVER